jgi:hypothetical protein
MGSWQTRVQVPKAPARKMTGKYALLYEYLEHRYADSIVLTFAQIEDVVGFPLPDQARSGSVWGRCRRSGSCPPPELWRSSRWLGLTA